MQRCFTFSFFFIISLNLIVSQVFMVAVKDRIVLYMYIKITMVFVIIKTIHVFVLRRKITRFTFLMNEFNTCSRTTSIYFVIWQYKFIFIIFERIWICHFVKVHTTLQITIWFRLGESDRFLNLYSYMCLHQFIIINHCYM